MAGPYTLKALPQTPQVIKDDGIQETPGPVRARLAMMDKQMDQLHKEKSLLEVSPIDSREILSVEGAVRLILDEC
jgi:hypothetical protein